MSSLLGMPMAGPVEPTTTKGSAYRRRTVIDLPVAQSPCASGIQSRTLSRAL